MAKPSARPPSEMASCHAGIGRHRPHRTIRRISVLVSDDDGVDRLAVAGRIREAAWPTKTLMGIASRTSRLIRREHVAERIDNRTLAGAVRIFDLGRNAPVPVADHRDLLAQVAGGKVFWLTHQQDLDFILNSRDSRPCRAFAAVGLDSCRPVSKGDITDESCTDCWIDFDCRRPTI